MKFNISILLLFCILSYMIMVCGINDPVVPEFEPREYEARLSIDGIEANRQVEKFFGNKIIDDGEGRPRTLSIWTKNEDSLALKLNNDIILGKDTAPIRAILKIDRAPKDWKEIYRDNEEQAKKKGKFEVSWWKNADTLLIADFENYRSRINNLNGEFGTWTCEECQFDTTQFINMFDTLGIGWNNRICLGVDYDIDSPNPAINGLYFKLNDNVQRTRDISSYKYISLWIRGDRLKNFPKMVQLEIKRIKSLHEAERVFLKNITEEWQSYIIHFDEFDPWIDNDKIKNWASIEEVVVTFSDEDLDVKMGRIYIDDIMFLDSCPYNANCDTP